MRCCVGITNGLKIGCPEIERSLHVDLPKFVLSDRRLDARRDDNE